MPRAQRREQLLDVALRLILGHGYAALSMEAVAREAGVAKTVVYGAFGNRTALLTALLEREQQRATMAVAAAIPSSRDDADPVTVVSAGLARFLDAVARDPDTWRLILLPVDGTPSTVHETVERHRERIRCQLEPIAGWVLEELGAGRLDTELVAHLILGNAEYLARLMLSDPTGFDPERLSAFVADLLLSGRSPNGPGGHRTGSRGGGTHEAS